MSGDCSIILRLSICDQTMNAFIGLLMCPDGVLHQAMSILSPAEFGEPGVGEASMSRSISPESVESPGSTSLLLLMCVCSTIARSVPMHSLQQSQLLIAHENPTRAAAWNAWRALRVSYSQYDLVSVETKLLLLLLTVSWFYKGAYPRQEFCQVPAMSSKSTVCRSTAGSTENEPRVRSGREVSEAVQWKWTSFFSIVCRMTMR